MLSSFMGEFSAFVNDKKCIKNVHKLIINNVLSFKGYSEKFYLAFYKCISYAENLFGGSLSKHASLLFGFELVNHVLGYLSSGSLEKDLVVQFIVLQISETKKNQLCFIFQDTFFLHFLVDQDSPKNNQNSREVLQ